MARPPLGETNSFANLIASRLAWAEPTEEYKHQTRIKGLTLACCTNEVTLTFATVESGITVGREGRNRGRQARGEWSQDGIWNVGRPRTGCLDGGSPSAAGDCNNRLQEQRICGLSFHGVGWFVGLMFVIRQVLPTINTRGSEGDSSWSDAARASSSWPARGIALARLRGRSSPEGSLTAAQTTERRPSVP